MNDRVRREQIICTATLLIASMPLLLVDGIHFQYNALLSAIQLLSTTFIVQVRFHCVPLIQHTKG